MLLEQINSPEDLKRIPASELKKLASELRQYIVDTLATHPGHLASSLGTVELTIALHYVFNTPDDRLIWDVGHQAYSHKILTGRREEFPSIRTFGGLSGFPKMDESEYDAFGTGHSSTSISAALGMAVASKLQGNTDRQHIAVIGDGSMTGGEAFEALNNAGVSKSNILVVLNDNGISIDKSVGGLSSHLTRITSSRQYNRIKEHLWRKTGGDHSNSKAQHLMSRTLQATKVAMLRGSNLFESLGFRYFGPIDGHDVENLIEVLSSLKEIKGPRLLHIVTKKGKGMKTAEKNPVIYHAPGLFDAETGKRISTSSEMPQPPKYQDVFGKTIIELAKTNQRIVGITPAMPTGCSLNMMMEQMPDRAFDVGIAEQHAVTFSAGLAAQGMIPFCNIYSSFMQRAFDQIIHDVALQRLPVVICLDRAGLVGDDGPTHHGVFDIACLRPIPNLTIAAPLNEHELRNMMFTAQQDGMGAFVIRYPRGKGVLPDWECAFEALPIGKGRQLQEGEKVAIASLGHIGNNAIAAARSLENNHGIKVGLFDMRFAKPLDYDLLDHIFAHYDHLITLEDGVCMGGMGSAIEEYLEQRRMQGAKVPTIEIKGIPDAFVAHGSVSILQKQCGLDTDTIVQDVVKYC